jgi:hypothetical protein
MFPALPTGDAHLAGRCRAHGLADIAAQIDAGMNRRST